MTTGFCWLDADGIPPGKDHTKEVALVEDALLYCTVKDAQPLVGSAVKSAVGAVLIWTVFVEEPHSLVAVSTTEKIPPGS